MKKRHLNKSRKMRIETLENRRLLCNDTGNPFVPSGSMEDMHPDFYYTPDTGALVMDTDGIWLQAIITDGPQPLQVDFLPQNWTTAYFNGSQQWFLAPLQTPWQGPAKLATYDANLNPASDLPCVETSINLDGDPNSQSVIVLSDVAIDDELPVASGSFTDVSGPGGSSYDFSITHTDNVFVDLGSVSNADFLVTGPNGYFQFAQLVSAAQAPDGSVTASYSVPAAGGSWDPADNGSYSISTVANEVTDLGGNAEAGGVVVGTFGVAVDIEAPTVTLVSAPDIIGTETVTSQQEIVVQFEDNFAIDVSDLGLGDLQVILPDGSTSETLLLSTSEASDTTPVLATYAVVGPGGDWTPATDNGTYQIRMDGAQVSDTNENFVPAGIIGSFEVNLIDVDPPEATVLVSDIVGPPVSGSQLIWMNYTDNAALDASELGLGDIEVVTPTGSVELPTFVSQTSNVDSPQISTTFSMAAPNGRWDIPDNGLYQIRVRPNQVPDTSGNTIPPSVVGTFLVDIADNERPTAEADASDIFSASTSPQVISVVYDDNVAVDVSDIGAGDIEVLTPTGVVIADFVSRSTNLDSTPVTATYSLPAPGGNWDITDNGVYLVRIRAGQVSDTSGNLVAQSIIGRFEVNVPDGAPTAVASAPDIVFSSSTIQTITVTYSDDIGIDASTIGALDIEVRPPASVPIIPVFTSTSGISDGTPITATYSLAPIGGIWDGLDNGTYQIFARPNQVLDGIGQAVAPVQIGSFDVSIGSDLFEDRGTTLGALTHNDEVDLADLDGDGDLDAFVTARNVSEEIWINDGNGSFTQLPQSLGTDNSIYSALGDIDGDGDIDAIVAATNEVVIWRNNGNAVFTSTSRIQTPFALDVALGDLNGDGDLDLFVAQNNFNPDLVFFNDGTGNMFFSGQQFAGLSSKSIEFADIDGDSDLDAVVGVQNGVSEIGNLVLLNDGNGFFTDSLQPVGMDSDQHVAVGDIDGDGDPDLVATSGSMFLNDGTGQYTQSTESIPYLITSHVVLEDFDLDGDLDIFQVNWDNNPDKIYLNDGTGAFVDSGIDMGAEFSSHAAAGDIDGDGDADLVVAAARSNEPNRIWFNNTLPVVNPNDFTGDGLVTGDDIDTICLATRDGSTNAIFDVDGNGVIESPDFTLYLDLIGAKLGDANLDGNVDVSDFSLWNANKFTANDPALPGFGWQTADFNCDGLTDVSDFSIWNANKFTSALRPVDTVADKATQREIEFWADVSEQENPEQFLAAIGWEFESTERSNSVQAEDRLSPEIQSTFGPNQVDDVFELLGRTV